MNTYIEPCGWRAVWRTSSILETSELTHDFCVEVLDVTHGALEATVQIDGHLYPPLDGPELADKPEERDYVQKLLDEKITKVPLNELYVINDTEDGEEFSVTAQIVEHVRFFYRYIWRPWDDVISSSRTESLFAEAILPHRIKFHFDIANGRVGKPILNRVSYLINEGIRLRKRLKQLESKVDQAVEGGDPTDTKDENGVDDRDLYEFLSLKMKLEDFDIEMRRLEDPILRLILLMEYTKNESSK